MYHCLFVSRPGTPIYSISEYISHAKMPLLGKMPNIKLFSHLHLNKNVLKVLKSGVNFNPRRLCHFCCYRGAFSQQQIIHISYFQLLVSTAVCSRRLNIWIYCNLASTFKSDDSFSSTDDLEQKQTKRKLSQKVKVRRPLIVAFI